MAARWAVDFESLTDVQERAVNAGVLSENSNYLVTAPTSSGKTFIGEMAAAVGAFSARRRSIFAVPFKALAEEHFTRMRARYEGLLSVVISDADWSEYDDDIRRGNFNLGVVTYEKLAALVSQNAGMLEQLTTLVVDEVQLVGDGTRGANLELFLTRVLTTTGAPRIVALSASIEDPAPLAMWLRATLVASSHRPVPLYEAVVGPDGRAITLVDEEMQVSRNFPAGSDHETRVVEMCRTLVEEGNQVLVFRSTVRPTVELANRLAHEFDAASIPSAVGAELAEIEDPDARATLTRLMTSGVAYHNADLAVDERRLIELAYRLGHLRVLVSTTTLAMGVNLPSDWVIVADTSRYIAGRNSALGISEYKNAAGRAGRLGQRSAGYAVLVAENTAEVRQLLGEYVTGSVEAVESQIPRHPFGDLVFRVICNELASDEPSLIEFLTSTYAYQTFYEPRGDGVAVVTRAALEAVDQCTAAGLVTLQDDRFLATSAAKQLSMSGFGLASAARLATEIGAIADGTEGLSDLLYAACSCVESGDRPWPVRQYRQIADPRQGIPIEASSMRPDGPLSTLMHRHVISDAEKSALTRFACVQDWINGRSARDISRSYAGAAPVRIQALGKNVAGLLEGLTRACLLSNIDQAQVEQVHVLATAARYGVPADLGPLARLRVPGVGREALLPTLRHGSAHLFRDRDLLLAAPYDEVSELLTPTQFARLLEAIERETADSVYRRLAGQITRASQLDLPEKLLRDLYERDGTALEQAVCDAMRFVGLPATRLLHQPHGEEDIRLIHENGTVVISVTASRDPGKPIAWAKAREVLGAGAGLNPANYVCIGRPRFESLALRHASDIGREAGHRTLLLLTIPAFGELILRTREGLLTSEQLIDMLATKSGPVDVDDL